MTIINGVPAHALWVHAVVVLVPLAAVLLLLTALWPRREGGTAWPVRRWRRWRWCACRSRPRPATTSSTTSRTPLLRTHTQLGDTMLPWAIGLFVVAAAVAAREHLRTRRRVGAAAGPGTMSAPATARRDADGHGPGGIAVTVGLAVLAVVVAVGSLVTVYRIGDSGSRAAWVGRVSAIPVPAPPRAPGG